MAVIAGAADLVPAPSNLVGFGGRVGLNNDGSIQLQTATGQPIQAYGSSAGFYSGPVVFGTLVSPAVSGSGLANLFFDGTNLKLSTNGGGYITLGAPDLTPPLGIGITAESGYGLTIKDPDNGAKTGLKIYANNLTQNVALGWQGISATQNFDIRSEGQMFVGSNGSNPLLLFTSGVVRMTVSAAGALEIAGGAALRNSTNPQSLIISRTYTDASNYSQLKIAASGSTVAFTADEAGTGAGTLTGYSLDRKIVFATDNAYDIGTNAGGRPANVYVYGAVNAGAVATFGSITAGNLAGGAGGIGAVGVFFWGQGCIAAPSNGVMRITNDGRTDFDRLQFGGETASFPALKRTGSDIEIVKADGATADTAIILSSPNGTRYRITVSNIGVVTATAQ